LIADAHALFAPCGAAQEPLTEFVGREFVDGAQAAIAEMIDVVDVPELARNSRT